MKNKIIIYALCGVLIAIILGISIYLIMSNNKMKNTYNTNDISGEISKITIIKKQEDKNDKTIEITEKNKIEELAKICNNVSLEQDEISKYLAIKKDVKIDLNNGLIFYIQLSLDDYCNIGHTETHIDKMIKMPNGLMEYIETILLENNI